MGRQSTATWSTSTGVLASLTITASTTSCLQAAFSVDPGLSPCRSDGAVMRISAVGSDEASCERREVGSCSHASSSPCCHRDLPHRGECADCHSDGAQQLPALRVARRCFAAARRICQEGSSDVLAGVFLRGYCCLFPLPSLDMSRFS